MVGEYLFHIGSFGVPGMGFCILIGAVLAVTLCYLLRKRTILDFNDEVLDAIIYAVLFGFVGMKVLYWIVTPGVLKRAFEIGTFQSILSLLTGGMVFYGGLIGGILGILFTAWRKKKNFFTFTDLLVPCFCIAHAAGRIGCLLAGCCAGVEVGEPFLFGTKIYGGACAVTYADGISRLPVPLFEAIFLLLLCAFLLFLFLRSSRRATVTGWYLVLYAVWRFLIEAFRGDEIRGIFGAFSTSQWISIAILLAGVVILLLSRKYGYDDPYDIAEAEYFAVFGPDGVAPPYDSDEEYDVEFLKKLYESAGVVDSELMKKLFGSAAEPKPETEEPEQEEPKQEEPEQEEPETEGEQA